MLIYIYAGYPILLWLLSKIGRVNQPCNEDYKPVLSIMIAAHNERDSLPAKLESIRRQSYPKENIQILIASDASSDGTNEYLAEQPDVECVAIHEQSGKNNALNQIIPLAKGEILFFTDANTILHKDALANAAKHYSHPKTGAVAGELIYTQDPDWNAVGQGTGLYWKYENAIKLLESQLGSVLVVSGALFSVKKDLVGVLHPAIANDLEIPIRAGAKGAYILYEPQCLGFEKPHQTSGEEWRRTSRIVARGMNGFLRLLPVMIQNPFRFWQFLSHKFLRWMTLPLCVLLLLSSYMTYQTWLSIAVLWIGNIALLLSIAGLWMVNIKNLPAIYKPITLLTHLLLMYSAATVGVLYGLFGKSPAVWKRPESTRK